MTSYYTPQQMAGGVKFNSKVRIGNWKEDIELEEQKLKDFELRRSRGDLLITKTSNRYDIAMQAVPHTHTASTSDGIQFGDSVVIGHELGAIACDLWDTLNTEGDTVVSVNNITSPVARNTFVITKPRKSSDDEDSTTVRYGEAFCLASNPSLSICSRTGYVKRPSFLSSDLKTTLRQAKLSMSQEVYMASKEMYQSQWFIHHINPSMRLSLEGTPVQPNEYFLLIHKATNTPLACEESYSYRSDYGPEYEVFCAIFNGTRKVNGLAAEKLGRRGADMIEAPSMKQNYFKFMTASNPGASVDVRGLKEMTPEVVLDMIKSFLLERGTSGIRGLAKLFNLLDDRGLGKLNHNDFKFGLMEYGISLSDDELSMMVNHFDKNGDGFIHFEEFLSAFRAPLSIRRQELITAAYKALDADNGGTVTLLDVERTFNVSSHPDVLSGNKSVRDVLIDFIAGWNTQDKNGIISCKEFLQYYTDISAAIGSEDYFELMMTNTWNIDDEETKSY